MNTIDKMLHGSCVNLRPIEIKDAENVVKWRNNPLVKQNFIYREDFTVEKHLRWMEEKVFLGKVVQYIIEDIQNDCPIGSVYFRDIDCKNMNAEFGIFIGEDYARGQGFGTESVKLFTEFGFQVLKLHRIFLRLLSDNQRAYRSYQRAGFEIEGVARDMVFLDGKYQDIIFMSLLTDGV